MSRKNQRHEKCSNRRYQLVRLRGVRVCRCPGTAIKCAWDDNAEVNACACQVNYTNKSVCCTTELCLSVDKREKDKVTSDAVWQQIQGRPTNHTYGNTNFIEMHLGEADQRYSSPYCAKVQRLKHNLADRHDRSRFVPSPSCWMPRSCFIRSPGTRFLDSMFKPLTPAFHICDTSLVGSRCNWVPLELQGKANRATFSRLFCLSDMKVIPMTDSGFNAFSFAKCVFDFLKRP